MKLSKGIIVIIPAIAFAAVVAPPISEADNGDSITLAPNFSTDPSFLSGTSGGGLNAQAFGEDCRGWVTPEVNHRMILRGANNAPEGQPAFSWMRVFVRAEGDTTLIIRGPLPGMETRCNDDRFGLNPGVEGSWPPGEYLIWIGSYRSSDAVNYRIGFTEHTHIH